MIEQIKIKNFKSLKSIKLNPRSLNILSGLNGMGKSSLIQVILLIKQSDNLSFGGELKLSGFLCNIGKGKDALYQFAEKDLIEFDITFNKGERVNLSFNYKPEWQILKSEKKDSKNKLIDLFSNLQYLSANRIGPESTYPTSVGHIEEKNLGKMGEYSIHFLHTYGRRLKVNQKLKHKNSNDLTLLNQVNYWLRDISPGIGINIVEVIGLDNLILNFEFDLGNGRTTGFRPQNVGFGITYTISVIVALLIGQEGDTIIIENPEAHIHPKGQAKLGLLMAQSASCGAQLFIETHSDHIINGVRVATRKKTINNSEVNFCWFSKVTTESEQYSELTEIKVDENGELNQYPKDFLDEWNNQLLNLV